MSCSPRVSVIIATNKRNEMLDRLLSSIEHLRVPEGINLEVLVSDNDPERSAKQIVENKSREYRWDLQYIIGSKRGPAAARNLAAKRAKGSLLAFVDDDEEPEEDWLNTYLVFFDNHAEAAGAGGVTIPVWEGRNPDWFKVNLPTWFKSLIGIVESDGEAKICTGWKNPPSGNGVYKREWFECVEGFDEFLMASEDMDLGFRIRSKGGYFGKYRRQELNTIYSKKRQI